MAQTEPQRSLSLGYPHAPLVDEKQWLSIIRRSLELERSKSNTISKASISIVPKTLMLIAPNCYIPQHVALGPNHYWRPELQDMEGYKIAAAKRVQQLRNLDFPGLVVQFMNQLEADIRACYQRFISFNEDTLAWVMVIDTAFLLEFLLVIYTKKKPPTPASHVLDINDPSSEILSVDEDEVRMTAHALSLTTSYTVDYAESMAFCNAIVRDIMMLENQIPVYLLRKMIKGQFSLSEESADSMLFSILKAFSEKFCPFKFMADLQKSEVSKCDHLLDYMYRMILPHAAELSAPDEKKQKIEDHRDDKSKEISCQSSSVVIELLYKIKTLLPRIKLPKKLQPITKVVALVERIRRNFISERGKDDNDPFRAPEIAIPSATELFRAGVHFSAVREGKFRYMVKFDRKRSRFTLPAITLDENTEVFLRNLVAYEASNLSGSLYFTRYTELMNGIVDTVEDVKLLKEKSIISNNLKSDKDAVQLWNGMNRSIRSAGVPELDNVIKDVNKYYNRRWLVKIERNLKHYVYESWQFLTFLAAILLLLLEMFEVFCSVYNCNTMFHSKYST